MEERETGLLVYLGQGLVGDTDTEDGGPAGSEVLGRELTELGGGVTPGLVVGTVQTVPQTGPEGGLVDQLHGLGGATLRGQLQLQPGQSPLDLPGLEDLVGDTVGEVVHPDLGLVPGHLDRVERVLPALGAAHRASDLKISLDQHQLETLGVMLWHLSSECQVSQITYKKVVTHLLQISPDPKCGHSRCDTESEGHSSIDISLIAGPGLDGHTDGGHGTVVLQGRDGQAIGQSGNLQGLGLDQLTLGLGNSLRLGSKCTLGSCLKSTNLVSLDLS